MSVSSPAGTAGRDEPPGAAGSSASASAKKTPKNAGAKKPTSKTGSKKSAKKAAPKKAAAPKRKTSPKNGANTPSSKRATRTSTSGAPDDAAEKSVANGSGVEGRSSTAANEQNPWAMPFGLGGSGAELPELPDFGDVGEFIRNQREMARLSVRRLAELANVSNPYLSQVERGLRKPSADILQQVANALRISVESLYVRAGMLPAQDPARVSTVPEAIEHDERLTAEQKTALRGVYDSFVND